MPYHHTIYRASSQAQYDNSNFFGLGIFTPTLVSIQLNLVRGSRLLIKAKKQSSLIGKKINILACHVKSYLRYLDGCPGWLFYFFLFDENWADLGRGMSNGKTPPLGFLWASQESIFLINDWWARAKLTVAHLCRWYWWNFSERLGLQSAREKILRV